MNDNLNELFNDFNTKLSLYSKEKTYISFNNFVYSLLKILNFCINNKKISLYIARNLGFILNNPVLKKDEEILSEKLYIFSGLNRLLDDILDDYEIKTDYSLKIKDEKIIKILYSFDRLEDICAVLSQNLLNIGILIFLYNLNSFCEDKNFVKNWLLWRKFKEEFITSLDKLNNADIDNVNLFYAYLCLYPHKILDNNLYADIIKKEGLNDSINLLKEEWFFSYSQK